MSSDAKARAAKRKDKNYKLAAGEGLYLQVRTNGGKYWKLKFRFGGKERKLSIGVYPAVGFYRAVGLELLADTREPKPAKFGVPPEYRMGMNLCWLS